MRSTTSSDIPLALHFLHKESGQGGTRSLILVLEEHEDIIPALILEGSGPTGQLSGLVGLLAETSISVGSRCHHRGIVVLARIGRHQGCAGITQNLVDRIVEPRGVAELEGGPEALGKRATKSRKRSTSFFRYGWKLKEDGSPAPAELLGDVQEVAELVLGLLELLWCVILREALSTNEKVSGTFPDQSVNTFRDGMR